MARGLRLAQAMQRVFSRRGLILLSCPLLLSGAAAIGVASNFSESGSSPLPVNGQDTERLLRKTPGAEARFHLGKLLAQRGRWTEAAELLVESLAVKEHRTESLRLLAQGSMTNRDWESARRYLGQLEQNEPRDPAIPKALAVSLLQSGDALGALSAAQRGLALEPEDGELVKLMSEAAEAATNPGSSSGPHQRPRLGRRNR